MRLTQDQFEIVVLAALDAMVDPLWDARGTGASRDIKATAASIIAALTREFLDIGLTLPVTLQALDIDDKVWDFMQHIERPGDENTPEPTPPDFTDNAKAFAALVCSPPGTWHIRPAGA